MEVIDSVSDLDDTLTEKNDICLNYSKEDVEALVLQAEKLVMNHRGTSVHYENSHNFTGDNSSASDSDYESKVSRDWLVQSEPNIHLRRSPSCIAQRRKKPVSSRRDWRHSLPECLEYWKQSNDLESEADESDDGQESEASLPLSDLWEHDPFVTEGQEQSDNDKATLPANLANFGEDYSAYLYSDTETDSDIYSEEDGNGKILHKNYICRVSQSKLSFKNILKQVNFGDDGLELEKLDQFEEVCRKNIAILFEQAQQLNSKHQIKSLKRLIVKWEKLKMNILDQRNSLRDLNLLKLNIENVGTDLDTLAGIILEEDEEYSQESPDEDQELTDMRHQLFEQVKSHLLEISDTLLQLNMSLHKIRSKSKLINPEQCHLEEKLQKLYEKWRLTHQAVTDVESKHHCYQIEKQQGEFSELLTEKLSRLVRTEEYVKNNSDFNGKSDDKSGGGGGWWRSLVKYSLVTGVVLVSLVSASYVWSYSKCQHGYYSTIWPLITFTTTGPRPY